MELCKKFTWIHLFLFGFIYFFLEFNLVFPCQRAWFPYSTYDTLRGPYSTLAYLSPVCVLGIFDTIVCLFCV